MDILTNERMRRVDEETVARFCPGLELMERAGRGVAEFILTKYPSNGFKASVFVGPGNNGGDALVVARYLSEAGRACSIHYLTPPDTFTMDSLKNHQRLQDRLVKDKRLKEINFERPDWAQMVRKDLLDSTLIVDGLFGTGLSRPLEGRGFELIQLINRSRLSVVSIDIPSGVNGDSGGIMGAAVQADYTVTMGYPKLGMLFYPGKSVVGEMIVADLAFPEEVLQVNSLGIYLLDRAAAAVRLPARRPDIHKFQAGCVLLVSGSRQYAGAAVLAAEAALRSGCGMLYAAVPESIGPIIQARLPEAIVIPLPETATGAVAHAAIETLAPYVAKADAVAVGPGLSLDEETLRFVRDFASSCTPPLVLDADGITAFAGHAEQLEALDSSTILTPHSGELKRLLGEDIPTDPKARVEKTRAVAKRAGITLVHKGAPSLIASHEGDVWVNHHGTSALATGGSGDVLTGIIAGLRAQGIGALDAANIASVIHGRAGELAAAQRGERSVIASDLFEHIGGAFLELESHRDGQKRR